MSLYRPTFHVTPVDLCIYSNVTYISCIMSCGNKIVSKLFQIVSVIKSAEWSYNYHIDYVRDIGHHKITSITSPVMRVGQRTNCSQPNRLQKSRHHAMSISRRDWLQPFRVMSIGNTNKHKDGFIINWSHPSHGVKETVIKRTIVPWITVKGINIKVIYPTANTKHIRLVARTLQLALSEWAQYFPNRKSHTLGTRCGVPPPLLGATKARDMELWEMAVIRDFRLSTNQNIIIRSMKPPIH